MKKNQSAARAACCGMLTALAFVLGYVETLIPLSIGVPGVKLGLANLVTVTGLYTVGVKATILISLVRIVLSGFTRHLFALCYSFAGWLVSMALMVLCRKKDWFGMTGVSVMGGVGHNLGQLFAAAFLVKQAAVFYYLPLLLVSGTGAGLCIGFLGGLLTRRVGRFLEKSFLL